MSKDKTKAELKDCQAENKKLKATLEECQAENTELRAKLDACVEARDEALAKAASEAEARADIQAQLDKAEALLKADLPTDGAERVLVEVMERFNGRDTGNTFLAKVADAVKWGLAGLVAPADIKAAQTLANALPTEEQSGQAEDAEPQEQAEGESE